ncbi:SusC/RagA family TonB-linked outer membrane protein [Ornithobacterium rhinotracheale]
MAEKSGKKIDFKASDLDDILVSPHDFKNLTLKEALEYLSSNYPIEVDYEKGKIEILRDYSRDQLLGLNNKIDLKSVVVTALGIKREEKSLGYALQEIKGDDLVASKEKNITNALSGKVAGLQVVKGSNGPAGSSKIVLRGNNSLTGDNQPLIVVDGIPMDNFTGATNNDFYNPSTDMGNGLGDLNPNDIESMSVLKGPAAAALYGSRAGNGVILITTKTGKKRKGLGITYNSSIGFETIFMSPDIQSSFGQGTNGIYNALNGSSWGPKIEGQTVENWDGQQVPLKYYNNLDNFMKVGYETQQSLSFQQQISEGTSLYSSITYVNNRSNIPGAELRRINFVTRALTKYGESKKLSTDFKIQYINSRVRNRPLSGSRIKNSFRTLVAMPVTVDVRDFENAVNKYGNHFWYNPSAGLNPYWAYKYDINKDSRDRFLLHGAIKYDFTDWLFAELKVGSDLYTTNNESKTYGKGILTPNGFYSTGKGTFNETNGSFLISATKDNLFGKFGMAATFGGNLMNRKRSYIGVNAGELEVPNLFSVYNSKGNPTPEESISQHKINSLYGTYQISYDKFLFLDFTGRNDWSSALSKKNRSFFYPSISTSIVFSEMIEKIRDEKISWLNYGKIRASYASVGNDMGPYQLYNTYTINKDPNGNVIAGTNKVLYNENVKNELIKSWELGFEAKMFKNRIGLDFSLYKSNATNQILNLPKDPTSGYVSEKVNAGDIENKGFELMLNADIIRAESFNWNLNVNLSRNINTIIELTEDVSQYQLGGFENVKILAATGEKYGVIYGSKYARVEDVNSPFYGEIIVDKEGVPNAANGSFYLGSQQPNALLGITNSFKYKNWNFSFLIDGRFGGKIFSGTNYGLKQNGNSALTVVDGKREDIIFNGVVSDGNGNYTKNTKAISPQLFWTQLSGKSNPNLGITEDNLYDATNIRIRNIQIGYKLPSKLTDAIGIQSGKIGFSVNNVLMLKSHLNGIDPESVYATGTNATGFEYFSPPTSRSYFINFSLSF